MIPETVPSVSEFHVVPPVSPIRALWQVFVILEQLDPVSLRRHTEFVRFDTMLDIVENDWGAPNLVAGGVLKRGKTVALKQVVTSVQDYRVYLSRYNDSFK